MTNTTPPSPIDATVTKIKALKKERTAFQSMEQLYMDTKDRYSRLSSKLKSERQHLENECDVLQNEWLVEERNYYYLSNVNEISKANLDKVRMENNWRNGVDKILPEFDCLQDLYDNKLIQQENMAKQLRKEQKSARENRDESMGQVRFVFIVRGLQLYVYIVHLRKIPIFLLHRNKCF